MTRDRRTARRDDPRHRLECRKVADRRRAVPAVRRSRAEGAAVQAAEHVQQRRGHAGRRDRPGPGAAGAGRAHRARIPT